jgi:hypothetical protein
MYKIPAGLEPDDRPETVGNEYLYYEPDLNLPAGVSPLHLSPHRLGTGPEGAFYHTLNQLFEKPDPTSTGWIFYNDEYPQDMSPLDRDPRVKAAQEKAGDDDKQLKQELIPIVQAIQDELVASWKQGKSDWPPKVQPKIRSGRSGPADRGRPRDHGSNGHCKGVLAFDLKSDTAFWLSHSTPRIPPLHEPRREQFF